MPSLCRYRMLIICVRADIIGNERIKYIYMQAKSRNFSHAWFQMADSFHTHRKASAMTIMVDRTRLQQCRRGTVRTMATFARLCCAAPPSTFAMNASIRKKVSERAHERPSYTCMLIALDTASQSLSILYSLDIAQTAQIDGCVRR